jgi:rhodanese-related sulfurtransferase
MRTVLATVLIVASFGLSAEGGVNITADTAEVTVQHGGKSVVIQREQDTENMIDFEFGLTSRPCPPFCIQPMQLAPGVETIGELEMLDYLQQLGKSEAVLVIDSRTPEWTANGIIPGATLIPWTQLHPTKADPAKVAEMLEFQFGAARNEPLWDFSNAKTLVFYCNGMWCGQSPTNIKALLNYGYPAHKLKWYRGGMQVWRILGLTVVKPQ